MSMISEQVADLREKAQIFEDSGCATNGIVKTFREAADTIEELTAKLAIIDQPPADQWIPCSERLPDKKGNYLVTSKGCTWVAYWFNNTWWGIEKRCRWTDVEAWMPLPEPYKGVE